MSQAELFDYPIRELPERYGIARSAVYVRMKRLNITPHTQGNRSYINASQLELLDNLHDFLAENSGRTKLLRSLIIALSSLSPEYILKPLQQKALRNNQCFRFCVRN